jgi:hypothetical protein
MSVAIQSAAIPTAAAIPAAAVPQAASPASFPATASRDLRLDYFRGLALLLIFIDHVSGNRFAAITLQSMGFADAAEVFVFIAGLAAVYAYRRRYLAGGLRECAAAVAQRIRTLYLAHLGMVAAVLVIAMAMTLLGTGFDIVNKLGLQPLIDEPVQALLRIPVLGFLPHYLDILPLYILLLASLPFILASMRVHPLLPVAIAAGLHACATALALNLPNFGHAAGWFLNPLTWALLFTAGASTAELALRGSFRNIAKPRMLGVTAAAAAYVTFAFLHAAPWRVFPALETFSAFDLPLTPDKTFLSWHRLADIAAKAWLAAVLIPPGAVFMSRGIGGAITRAGRHSLPLFISGTYLAVLGSVILFETEGHALAHIGVTAGGVIVMLAQGWFAERQKPHAIPSAIRGVAAAG